MDEHAPATKADITALRNDIEDWKEEIIRHFDVVAENLTKDFQGAFGDGWDLLKEKQANHERRIRRLERHFGMTV